MGDLILGAKAGYLLASEVRSVVGDDGVGEPKATHYVLPEELDNLLPSDFGERHCLDPFEVVGGPPVGIALRLRSGEWSNYTQPLLHEGSMTAQGGEVSTRHV